MEGEETEMRRDPDTLFEMTHRAMYSPKERIEMVHRRGMNRSQSRILTSVRAAVRAKPFLKNFQRKLEKATIFQLEDDFVCLAVQASMEAPDKILGMLRNSDVPYDLMWVEWNELLKVLELGGTEGLGEAFEMGMLIERDHRFPDLRIYQATMIAREKGARKIILSPVGLRWTPQEGQSRKKLAQTHDMRLNGLFKGMEQDEDENSLSMMYGLGPNWIQKYLDAKLSKDEFIDSVRPNHWYTELREITRQAVYAVPDTQLWVDGWLKSVGQQNIKTRHGEATRIIQGVMESFATIVAGDLRWIVTVMGLLNAFEVVGGTKMQLPLRSPETKKGPAKPYYEYRKIGIKVPKLKLTTLIARQFGGGRPKRAHMVRGHYRTRRNGVKLPREKWQWIPSHIRGDASLGWVQKDYVVEANPELKR